MKDVGAEEWPWVAAQLVKHPTEPPDGKERIAEIRHRVHVAQLRKEQYGAERDESNDGDRVRAPRDSSGVRLVNEIELGVIDTSADRREEARGIRERPRAPIDRQSRNNHHQRNRHGTIRASCREAISPDPNRQPARQRNDDGSNEQGQRQPVEDGRRTNAHGGSLS